MRTRVTQYNSSLSWLSEGTPDTQDGDGNIIPGVPGDEETALCRYENYQAGNRKEVIGRDGKTVLALGRIFIKFGEPVPPRFFIGTITNNGEIIYKGEIVNTFEGQMNKTVYAIEDVRD